MLMLEILVENKQTLLSEINSYRLMYVGHIPHRDENKPQESNLQEGSRSRQAARGAAAHSHCMSVLLHSQRAWASCHSALRDATCMDEGQTDCRMHREGLALHPAGKHSNNTPTQPT